MFVTGARFPRADSGASRPLWPAGSSLTHFSRRTRRATEAIHRTKKNEVAFFEESRGCHEHQLIMY